jgi:hypothetical protein
MIRWLAAGNVRDAGLGAIIGVVSGMATMLPARGGDPCETRMIAAGCVPRSDVLAGCVQAENQVRSALVADSVNTAWDELPAAVREGIERCTGPVAASFPGGEGVSTMVRLVLDTDGGRVFVKGVGPATGDLARGRLGLGAALAPFVPSLSPPPLFRVQADGWDVTVWPAVPGRPADLRPGSADIPRVVGVLAELGAVRAPDVPLRSVAEDWATPADDPGALDGEMLVHTDLHGGNFIVGNDRVWLVDWGWAKRGPAWMTAARLALFLMEAGWEPADADRALAAVPAWAEAPHGLVTAYAVSSVGSWERACRRQPDNKGLRVWLGIVRKWADHRAGMAGVRTLRRPAGWAGAVMCTQTRRVGCCCSPLNGLRRGGSI